MKLFGKYAVNIQCYRLGTIELLELLPDTGTKYFRVKKYYYICAIISIENRRAFTS